MSITYNARQTVTRVCAVAAAWVVTATAHAGFIVIDDFSDTSASWPVEVFTGQPSDGDSESGLSGVLGGNRSTTLSNGAFATGLDRASVTITPNVQGGVLDYNSTVMASSDMTLVYGINAPAFDFSGQSGIVLSFLGFDFPEDGPLQINALLTSNGETMTAAATVADSGAGQAFINFEDLVPLRGSFDLADVDDVAIEFVAAAGSDFRLGAIMTSVPTPSSLVILVASFCISGRRRRI